MECLYCNVECNKANRIEIGEKTQYLCPDCYNWAMAWKFIYSELRAELEAVKKERDDAFSYARDMEKSECCGSCNSYYRTNSTIICNDKDCESYGIPREPSMWCELWQPRKGRT